MPMIYIYSYSCLVECDTDSSETSREVEEMFVLLFKDSKQHNKLHWML